MTLDQVIPDWWDTAREELIARDRVMRRLIPEFGPIGLRGRREPFFTLARAIVGQQISVKAADAVWARLEQACGLVQPETVLTAELAGLRAAGLSQRKCEYLLDLASHFQQGRVHPTQWQAWSDAQVLAELTAIRGIGRWTAEMFLIFNLHRANVLPLDDIGLMRAISQHYFSGEPVSRFEAREVAEAWQPWCTAATWYLWRSIDPVPVEY